MSKRPPRRRCCAPRTSRGSRCAPTWPASHGSSRGEPDAGGAARMKERLTLALPEGRLLDGALEILSTLGVDGIDQDSLQLIFSNPPRRLRLHFLKPVA